MKLVLSRNIGAKDAKRLGLTKVQRGDAVTGVKKEALDELRSRGLVIETKADGTVVEATATDETPDFDSMNLEQLRAYAKENEVEGVTTSINKDETLKLVKKHFNKVRG
jgi:DNA-binding transcriptional regulator YhcF (GntR family)